MSLPYRLQELMNEVSSEVSQEISSEVSAKYNIIKLREDQRRVCLFVQDQEVKEVSNEVSESKELLDEITRVENELNKDMEEIKEAKEKTTEILTYLRDLGDNGCQVIICPYEGQDKYDCIIDWCQNVVEPYIKEEYKIGKIKEFPWKNTWRYNKNRRMKKANEKNGMKYEINWIAGYTSITINDWIIRVMFDPDSSKLDRQLNAIHDSMDNHAWSIIQRSAWCGDSEYIQELLEIKGIWDRTWGYKTIGVLCSRGIVGDIIN